MCIMHIKQLRQKAVSEVKIHISKKMLVVLRNSSLKVKQLNEKRAVSEDVGNFLKWTNQSYFKS